MSCLYKPYREIVIDVWFISRRSYVSTIGPTSIPTSITATNLKRHKAISPVGLRVVFHYSPVMPPSHQATFPRRPPRSQKKIYKSWLNVVQTRSKCKKSSFQVHTTSFLRPRQVYTASYRSPLAPYHAHDHVLQVLTTCSLRSYYVQPVRTTRSQRIYHVGTGFSDLP